MRFALLRALLVLSYCTWAAQGSHITAHEVHTRIKSSADRLLHVGGTSKLELPIDVDVILLGFDGHGAYQYYLDEDRLTDLLQDHYEIYAPISRETEEPLATEYFVEYNVVEIGSKKSTKHVADLTDAMDRLEREMHQSFVYTGTGRLPPHILQSDDGRSSAKEQKSYSIEATKIEPFLDEIVASSLDAKAVSKGVPNWYNKNVVVILNPCKRRMAPSDLNSTKFEKEADFELSSWDKMNFDVSTIYKEEGDYGYYWTYEGQGTSTTWTSKGSYVVIDISAGPVRYGKEMAPSGVVSPRLLPRIIDVLIEGVSPLVPEHSKRDSEEFLKHIAEVRDTMFMGRLSSLIVSLIRHCFLNDIWIDNTLDMKNVVVPIIVLRNHDDFHPFRKEDAHFINSSIVQEQLKDLVVGQRAVVFESLHSLHQHKALAVAFYKAMMVKSEAVVTPPGAHQYMHTRLKYYIDGEALLEEFSIASDMLATALINKGHPNIASDASNMKKSLSDRTIPVFVLSLKDVPFDLSFHNDELVVSNDEVVIVLQTVGMFHDQEVDAKYSGHFIGNQPVIISTVEIERHIMAGLVTAVAGIVPPFESYNPWKKQVTYDWLWATGHTPFGPYSSCKTLSQVTKQAAHRNALVGRLERIIRKLRMQIYNLDEFAMQHSSYMPSSEDFNKDAKREKTWADYLYKQSKSFEEPPMTNEVIKKLETSMERLETQLISLLDDFFDADFNKADETLRNIGWKLESLIHEVNRDIAKARNNLGCCKLQYKLDNPRKNLPFYLVGFIIILILAALYFLFPAQDNRSGPILAS